MGGALGLSSPASPPEVRIWPGFDHMERFWSKATWSQPVWSKRWPGSTEIVSTNLVATEPLLTQHVLANFVSTTVMFDQSRYFVLPTPIGSVDLPHGLKT